MSEGPSEERILITGLHTVCDIYCNVCQTVLGWKYVSCHRIPKIQAIAALNSVAQQSLRRLTAATSACEAQEEAFEESQKYKEGKFIVEKLRMMCNEGWV